MTKIFAKELTSYLANLLNKRLPLSVHTRLLRWCRGGQPLRRLASDCPATIVKVQGHDTAEGRGDVVHTFVHMFGILFQEVINEKYSRSIGIG